MRGRGFTLIQVVLLISIGGSVLAILLPTFARVVRRSKIAEATEQLAALHRATAAYYARRHETASGSERSCLPPRAGPTPSKPALEPRAVDFAATEVAGGASWRALGFAPRVPLRYRYSFLPKRFGCGLSGVRARGALVRLRAEGDLDGDGELSTFERASAADESGALVPQGGLRVQQRIE